MPREAMSQFKKYDYDSYPKTKIHIHIWAIGTRNGPQNLGKAEGTILASQFLPFGSCRRIC